MSRSLQLVNLRLKNLSLHLSLPFPPQALSSSFLLFFLLFPPSSEFHFPRFSRNRDFFLPPFAVRSSASNFLVLSVCVWDRGEMGKGFLIFGNVVCCRRIRRGKERGLERDLAPKFQRDFCWGALLWSHIFNIALYKNLPKFREASSLCDIFFENINWTILLGGKDGSLPFILLFLSQGQSSYICRWRNIPLFSSVLSLFSRLAGFRLCRRQQ